MQLVKAVPRLTALCAVVAWAAPGLDVPAQDRGGPLPVIPVQAVGGGEVFLEVTVSIGGVVTDIRKLRVTPPYTEVLTDAVGQWQFRPAEEAVPPASGQPADPNRRRPVESK